MESRSADRAKLNWPWIHVLGVMPICRSRSVYLDRVNAANACAGFVRKDLIKMLIHSSRSLEASRIVFVEVSTSVVHYVSADPRRQLGITS